MTPPSSDVLGAGRHRLLLSTGSRPTEACMSAIYRIEPFWRANRSASLRFFSHRPGSAPLFKKTFNRFPEGRHKQTENTERSKQRQINTNAKVEQHHQKCAFSASSLSLSLSPSLSIYMHIDIIIINSRSGRRLAWFLTREAAPNSVLASYAASRGSIARLAADSAHPASSGAAGKLVMMVRTSREVRVSLECSTFGGS